MDPDDIAYLSVDEQLAGFASGALSPRDVLAAQLARVDRFDGRIRAVTDRFDDLAITQAFEAERRWRAGDARPLEGVTVAVKEEQAMTREPLLFGSRSRVGRVGERDHPVVERIRAAGGIIHLRTTTPEYSAAGFSRSSLWGETVSPWHPALSAGGSSGGSGAALAAGFCSTATGSDVAGSLRIPASACGVVGFKPSYGSVPALPTESFDTYCHDGAMGRTVRDALHLHDQLIGQHPDDFISLPSGGGVADAAAGVDLSTVRIAVVRRMGDAPQLPIVTEGMDAAARILAGSGATLVEMDLPWRMHELAESAFAHYGAIMAPMIREGLGDHYADAEPYTRDFVESAERALAERGHYSTIQAEARLQEELARLFDDVDVIVCPTGMIQALPAGDDVADHRLEVDGTEVRLVHHLEAFFAMPFNMASRLPVLAVPTPVRRDGPPSSVQVVGRPYAPAAAARVASIIEEAAGWYRRHDRRPALGNIL